MCGHVSTSEDTCPCLLYSDDLPLPPPPPPLDQFPPQPFLMSHHQQPLFATALEFESSGFGYFDSSLNGGGGGSSCCDSPSSMGSCGGEQRSVSSHNGFYGNFTTVHDLFNDHDGPVRRALSAGDLPRSGSSRRESNSGVWSESNAIIEGMGKAYKYSPQEKKEKIDKYRIKRNLRNFNKRIKYECRKTLADSRPRIRGRFARNDEKEQEQEQQVDVIDVAVGDVDTWTSFLDSFSTNHFLN